MSLLQMRNSDFPYHYWNLRSVAPELAKLDIETKRLHLKFEIYPGFVRLVNRKEECLQHIVNKDFTPGSLLLELQKSGINLLPENDDAQLCSIEHKNKNTEEMVIKEISNSIKLFAFR